MSYKDHVIYTASKDLVTQEFDERRADGRVSRVHDIDHVTAVSNYAAATARALSRGQGHELSTDRRTLLAGVAGLLHDIVREAKETETHGNLGADYVEALCEKQSPWNFMLPHEVELICDAIRYHEGSFADVGKRFGDPIGGGYVTPSIIAHGIVTGDKALEASGPRVLERRAFFVGRERVINGDLEDIFKCPEESYLAVLGETLIRLYAKNPIDTYPFWLAPFAQKLHATQYQFLTGLLRYSGMTEAYAAEFMLGNEFPKFTQELVDKITDEQHLDGGHFGEDYPVLAEELGKLNDTCGDKLDDLAESSAALVELFASHASTEEAITAHTVTDLIHFDEFMRGIQDYREGSEAFVGEFERSVEDAVRAKLAE